MMIDDLSRRSLLQAIAATLAALPFAWEDAARAALDPNPTNPSHAHAQASPPQAALSFFNAADAADVEAVAAQIIPTDDTPGAREAGVVFFIDRALGTFFAQLGGDYRAHLADFQTAFRKGHPDVASFAALPSAGQIAHLTTVDRTPFFETTRLLALLGMFTLPSYGGNRDGVGWTLIGFEDRHYFRPPFGYYDRDYPGFAVETVKEP